MIQRIQTIYLLIAVALTGVMFVPMEMMDNFRLVWKIFIYSGWGLSVIFSLFAIFQYKNRSKQVKSCLLAMLFIACAYGVIIWQSFKLNEQQISYNPLIAFPMIAFILLILAIIAIRKDEKLVRSADRLR
ncbi:MAG: DUF4293 domain-containing protein [Dysgonamonadaceae bacterium]|jgi:peptidoglycan/LPS O-acetylase OafA/YrhL|nr:DUF4293 domain-containing protein [Dysgonamonadaceae bacterium]